MDAQDHYKSNINKSNANNQIKNGKHEIKK